MGAHDVSTSVCMQVYKQLVDSLCTVYRLLIAACRQLIDSLQIADPVN